MEKQLAVTPCKVAIVGPESTGKSMMAHRLAREFGTLYVPEYSRYYCEGLHNEYTLQDEVNIYFGQIALEDGIIDVIPHSLLFCDTTILTVKIWSDYLFGSTPEIVLDEIRRRNYDRYLLMDIDLPWVDDPLRDFPDKREYFLEVWKNELEVLNARYQIISGLGEERYRNGIRAVRNYLKESQSYGGEG